MKSLLAFLALMAVSGYLVATFTDEKVSRDSIGLRSGREPLNVVPLGSEKRLDFNGNSLGVGLCAPDPVSEECNWGGYGQGVGRLSLAPFVFTLIVLLSFWVFCSGRLCYNCFGGKERTPGNICYGRMCCGKDCFVGRDFHGYTDIELWIVKVALVLLVCALAASAIPGFSGNAKISEGIKGPTNNVGLYIRNISDRTVAIINELSELNYSKNANASIGGLTDFTKILTNLTDQANSYVKEADRYRRPIYITIIIIAPFFALIGLVAGFFNLPKLTCCIGLCLFWISMIVWIIFSLQYLLVLVFEDACTETTIWSANLAYGGQVVPGSRKSFFEKFIETDKLNQTFTDLRRSALDGENAVIEAGNSILDELCYNSTASGGIDPVFSAGPYCTTNTSHTADRLISSPSANITDYKRDTSDGCVSDGYTTCATICCRVITIQECATRCAENRTRTASSDLISYIDLFQKYDSILFGKILPFLSYDTFIPLVVGLRDPICNGLVQGGQIVEQCLLCIAIFLIPTTILMLMASKRWRDDSAGPSESTLELQTSKSGQSPSYVTTPTVYAMNSDNEVMDMTVRDPPKEEEKPEEIKEEPPKDDPLLSMTLSDDPKPRSNTQKSGEIDFGLMDFGLPSNRGSMLPPDRRDSSSESSDSDSDERLEMAPPTPPDDDEEPGTPPSYDDTFA